MPRYLIHFCLTLLFADVAIAQNAALIPVRRPQTGTASAAEQGGFSPVNSVIQTGARDRGRMTTSAMLHGGIQSVNSQTKWAFKARDSAVLSTPIVRLGDIIEPLDPSLAAWQRLKRVSIGLLPTDGTAMIIQRDRLSHTITTIEATPREIDWYGAAEITVHYDPASAAAVSIAQYNGATSQQASNKHPIAESMAIAQTSGIRELASETPFPIVLDQITRDRIRYWIELAIRRELREIVDQYDVQLENNDDAIAVLAAASSIANIELMEPAREGRVRLRVIGRHRDGPITAEVSLAMQAHPSVVVATMNLQRGERIGASDVRMAPLPSKQWKDSFATSIPSVIGMEVRGIVREGAPIALSEIGPPILIHRGDLLEVRVVGGGVMITTNAKSLGEGAEAELIEVETIQPRRRLIAKIVSPGLVEIVTRAPRVK